MPRSSKPIGFPSPPTAPSSSVPGSSIGPRACTITPPMGANCSMQCRGFGAATPVIAASRSSRRSAIRRAVSTMPRPSRRRTPRSFSLPLAWQSWRRVTSIMCSFATRARKRSTRRSRSRSPITSSLARARARASSLVIAATMAPASAAPRSAAFPRTAICSSRCSTSIASARPIPASARLTRAASPNGASTWPTIFPASWRSMTPPPLPPSSSSR
jgi:hypothetical protein